MSAPGLSPGELQRRAARGVTWSSLNVIVSLPLTVVVSVVLARGLGPEEFAKYAFLTFTVGFVLGITDLGYALSMVRSGSLAYASGDLDGTRALLHKAVGWNLLRFPVALAATLLISSPPLWLGVVVSASLLLTMAAGGFVFALQAANRGAAQAKFAFVQGLFVSLVSIAATAAGASGTEVWGLSLAAGFVVTPAYVLAIDPRLRRAALTPRLPRDLPHGFIRYGLTAMLLSLASTLVFSRSEIVLLNALGETQALAVFALAFGLAQRLTSPIDTLLGPLIPALAALAETDPARLRAGFARALRLAVFAITAVTAIAPLTVMFIAPTLFGPEYEGTGIVFVCLAVASLVRSATQPYIAVIYALGYPQRLLLPYAFALVLDIVLALVLIPPLGVWGAVIANATSGLLASGLAVRVASTKLGLEGVRPPLLTVAAATLAATTAGLTAGAFAQKAHPLLGGAACAIAGFTAFMLISRRRRDVLTPRDAEVLIGVLPARLAGGVRRWIPT